jgi:accessory colonization factor AcfC
MEPKIRRKFKAVAVTISTSTATSTTLRWDDVAGGALEMGTVSTSATSIQVWASDSESSAFGRLYNADGSAADITMSASTTESRVYALPDACYGAGAIKLVAGQAAGTGAVCIVTMKT